MNDDKFIFTIYLASPDRVNFLKSLTLRISESFVTPQRPRDSF